MLFPKVKKFLENQKQHMMALDGATEETAFLTERESQGLDFRTSPRFSEDFGSERPVGLLEILYNNTIGWLLSASEFNGFLRNEFDFFERHITEDTTSGDDIATFTTKLLPAVRRFYANLISKELVSVQPLSSPNGKIYWIDTHFTDTDSGEGITAGDRLDEHQYSD